MVQINFNATQYDPSLGAGGDVFENGIYGVQITGSEVKATKRGDGYMLIFTMTCIDPQFAGKRIIARLNIQNPNVQAVEIAYRELSAISHVVGILQWQDTQQLHGRPFKVQLEKKPRDDDPTKFGNEIRGYLDYAGNPPVPAGGHQGAGPAVAPAAPQAPLATAPAPSQAPVQYTQAPAPAQVPDPAAAAAPAPWQAPAPAAAPAPAPSPQPTAAPAPWQAPSPAPVAAPAAAPAPWQTGAPPPAAAPAGAIPPWQQQG